MTAATELLADGGRSERLARRPELLRLAAGLSLFAALAVWALAVRAPFLSIERSDDAFFLEIAHLWTRGALPYVGAFDIKPPGFFAILVGAEALLGSSLRTINAVSILSDAVTALALYHIGRRMGSRALGLFASLLYPLLSDAVANNAAYAPLAAFTTLAFLAALSPLPIMRRSALAGLAIGAAFTIKQTAAFEGLALIVILIQAPEAAARRIGAAAAFVLAAAAGPLAFLIYFAAHGAAGAMIAEVVGAALLRPASAIEHVSFLESVARTFVYLARPIEPILILACLALMRRRAIFTAASGIPVSAIGLWAAATMLSVWVQHALFRAYLAPMFAPLLLLAGAGVVFAAPELRRLTPTVRLALVGLVTTATALYCRSIGPDARPETQALEVAAAAIQATHPRPDDRLYVAGRGLWLHMMTDLPPPTAYFHWEHTLCDFPGAGPERLAEALAAAPRYVVVSRIRYGCELSASRRQVEAALAQSYRPLVHAEGDSDSYDVFEAVAGRP